MKKIIIMLFIPFIFSTPTTDTLELLVKLDIGLSPSGRNGSFLGRPVTNIGDVNNDGYDDWAIGLSDAAIYETGEKKGKVYIYFGDSHISNEKNPDIILTGENDRDNFGSQVSSAGDVNNDGYDDILIGADYHRSEGADIGCVYIFYGGNPMDTNPDAVFTSEGVYFNFGISISEAGDVNNDGFDDVIIGTRNFAYIYFGSANIDPHPDIILTGESERDYFGFCVSRAGDVNHDGFSDVIVGAHGYYLDGYDTGRAYIYYGDSFMDSTADIILTGESAGDYFGENVSDAGDVNNDGFYDVIVSAHRNDS